MFYTSASKQMFNWQVVCILGASATLVAAIYFLKKNSKDLKSGKSAIDDNNIGTSESNETTNISNEVPSEHEFDEDIAFLSNAIENCPKTNTKDLAICYQIRAAAYEKLNKWNNVKQDCTHSIEYDPYYTEAYFRRARAYEALNDMSKCLHDAAAACILEMFENDTILHYADEVFKKSGHAHAEKNINKWSNVLPSSIFIRSYLRAYKTDPIIELELKKQSKPKKLHGFLRAKNALDMEKYEDVIPACTEELQSSELLYKTKALFLRGTFYLLSGQFESATHDFNSVINDETVDIDLRTHALIRRAYLRIQTNNSNLGLSDFVAAELLSPKCPDVYHQRALAFILLDRLSLALRDFERVLQLAPDHNIAYAQKCFVNCRLSMQTDDQLQLDKAMEEFNECIKRFPDCTECYTLMAQVLSDQFQFSSADEFYEKAIATEPDNGSLYVYRAMMVLQWKRDIQKSVELLEQAIQIDGKCALAYEALGNIEVQRANIKLAVKHFKKAIMLSKSFSDMYRLYTQLNVAKAQISVIKTLGLNMSTLTTIAQNAADNNCLE